MNGLKVGYESFELGYESAEYLGIWRLNLGGYESTEHHRC